MKFQMGRDTGKCDSTQDSHPLKQRYLLIFNLDEPYLSISRSVAPWGNPPLDVRGSDRGSARWRNLFLDTPYAALSVALKAWRHLGARLCTRALTVVSDIEALLPYLKE